MKKKSKNRWIILMLIYPISLLILYIICRYNNNLKIYNSLGWAKYIIALIPVLIAITELNNSKSIEPDDGGRETAKYPIINEKILFNEPPAGSVCFGKDKRTGKYVCKPADMQGSVLIIGGSGCGKSTSIIEPLILNAHNNSRMNNLIVDLKGELHTICCSETDDEGIAADGSIIFSVINRRCYGFDAFYNITKDSSSQEIFETMQVVAFSLISVKADSNSSFWQQQARKMFRSLLTYYFKQGVDTIADIVTMILSRPIEDQIKEIISKSKPTSTEYMDMIDYSPDSMAAETRGSIVTNMVLAINNIATDNDLHWALGENPRKVKPFDLLEHSIYLELPQHKLDAYAPLIFLICNSVLKWGMSLPEKSDDPSRPYLGIILDEFTALLSGAGQLELLPQFLRICARSKGFCVVVCTQSLSGIRLTLGKEATSDLIGNLAFKCIMSCSDPEDARTIVAWGGKFNKKKRSTSTQSNNNQSQSLSYDDDDIITPEELITLGTGSGELILISDIGGYCRIKKTPAYADKYFKPLLDEVAKSKTKER